MKNQIQLNIHTPCSEDFNTFSPTAKGGLVLKILIHFRQRQKVVFVVLAQKK